MHNSVAARNRIVDKYLKVLAVLESKVLSVDRSALLLDVIDYINNFDYVRESKPGEVGDILWHDVVFGIWQVLHHSEAPLGMRTGTC